MSSFSESPTSSETFKTVPSATRREQMHPRMTLYRALFLLAMWSTVIGQAVASYMELNNASTTLGLLYSVVLASIFYWIGLYEYECSGRLRWLFDRDIVEVAGNLRSFVGDSTNIFRCTIQSILRVTLGYARQRSVDAEQNLRDHHHEDDFLELAVFIPEDQGFSTGYSMNSGVQVSGMVHRNGATQSSSSGVTYKCGYCDRDFSSKSALHNHCSAKADHPYCTPCNRLFGDKNALGSHLQNASVHVNGGGDTSLPTRPEPLKVHSRALEPYCSLCDRSFVNEAALEQHTRDSSAHHFCKQCNRQFGDWEAICCHLSASHQHNWCFACSKDFPDHKKLSQHCNTVHSRRGEPTECPLCDKEFDNPIFIASHIERGCA